MYCDKWEDWANCCRNNTDRSCEADSLKSSHEDSADNADSSDDACSLNDAESSGNADRSDEADSSDDENDSNDSTAKLMTASVVRLIANLTARTENSDLNNLK